MPAATAGELERVPSTSPGWSTFTPVGGGNAGVSLDVPYYLVPQATSNISTELDANKLRKQGTAAATVTNKKGAVTGAADWYAWGLSDGKDKVAGSADIDSVGIQAFPGVIAFAISTNQRWSNAAQNEFDIFVDVNGDAVDDYDVVGADLGALTAGVSSGQMATAVFDLRTGAGSIQFLADAPFDSTTLVLPVLVSQLCAAGSPCLSAGNPRIAYHAVGFNLENNTNDTADGPALFNAFTPAISNGMFDVVAPNGTAIEAVSVNAAEWAQTPPLGLMIVSHDNESKSETQTIKVKAPERMDA